MTYPRPEEWTRGSGKGAFMGKNSSSYTRIGTSNERCPKGIKGSNMKIWKSHQLTNFFQSWPKKKENITTNKQTPPIRMSILAGKNSTWLISLGLRKLYLDDPWCPRVQTHGSQIIESESQWHSVASPEHWRGSGHDSVALPSVALSHPNPWIP